MRILSVAGVELRRWSRDRSNVFFVFVLPIAIIVLVGSLYGAGAVPVVGLVAAGEVGDELAAVLGEDLDVVRFDDPDDLILRVERGTLEAGLVVPDDYGEKLLSGGTVEVGFVARPGSLLGSAAQAALTEQATVARAAAFAAAATGTDPADLAPVAGRVAEEIPSVVIEARTTGESLFPTPLGRFDIAAPSQLVLFMFLTALTGAVVLIGTKRLGVARRMLATPTSAGEVVAGEALARFAIALIQGIYIVVVSAALFGVTWGDPWAASAVVLLFAAAAAGAAMLLGAVFSTEQQAGGIGVMGGIGLGALGGTMVPLELYSPAMRTVAHLTPHAWALDAFAALIRENAGIGDIARELGALAVFSAVLLALASAGLRRALTR